MPMASAPSRPKRIRMSSETVCGNLPVPSRVVDTLGPTWRVVVKRTLETGDANDTQFKVGMSVPIAFAVWDGNNIERNGMKALSTWFTLKL